MSLLLFTIDCITVYIAISKVILLQNLLNFKLKIIVRHMSYTIEIDNSCLYVKCFRRFIPRLMKQLLSEDIS